MMDSLEADKDETRTRERRNTDSGRVQGLRGIGPEDGVQNRRKKRKDFEGKKNKINKIVKEY